MVPVTRDGRVIAELETRVYLPTQVAAAPVVILLHGSSGGEPRRSYGFAQEARFYTDLGFIVVASMRRGRGQSTGRSEESEERNCVPAGWSPAIRSAFEDIDATIAHARTLPGTDGAKILLHGMSRGGFLAVAYAAEGRYRHHVAGVVNLVGGWVAQAEDRCPEDFNLLEFRRLGAHARFESLWLYGAGDRFYGDEAVYAYADAYRQNGGRLTFQLVKNVPENGHWLPDHPSLWTVPVRDYLQRLHLSPRTVQ